MDRIGHLLFDARNYQINNFNDIRIKISIATWYMSEKTKLYFVKNTVFHTEPEKCSPELGHSCIVMVNNAGTWGSGVIFNHKKGLVLTCSHVVKGADKGTETSLETLFKYCPTLSVSVRMNGGVVYEATVVYAVPRDAIFDLALLHMHDFSSDASDPAPALQFTEGAAICCVSAN